MQRYPLRLFFKDYTVLTGFLSAFFCDIFLWIYVPIKVRALSDLAFLHYTIHFGVDFIGARTNFFLIPVLGFVVLIIHTGLGYWLYAHDKVLARYLMVSQTVLCVFLIMSAISLFIIN